ncbi:MAG: hypothetical protein OES26_27785, partial [Gammaproteobacteria bacterium]|nr:hypothetical protein [Gammaproteobacteria bacterium]
RISDPDDPNYIDPFFLDNGNVSPDEQKSVEAYVDYQERSMTDRAAIQPRGGRPRRGPNYRFLHWPGRLGDSGTSFVGPLSISPKIDDVGPYLFNAQILGFNTSTSDWKSRKGGGTLSVEFRSLFMNESMTWLYLETFEATNNGGNTVGLEYVAQRDNLPVPVICEEPNLDIRITLIRHRKAPGVLRKILRIGSLLTGAPTVGMLGDSPSSHDYLANRQPVMRVPQMVQEGVAFTQATLGGMSDEAPIWRSGFTSYAVASGGSRLALRPGLWVAIDDSLDIDYSSIVLQDDGGRVSLVQNGKYLDVNYLVLALEIDRFVEDRGVMPKGVIEKGKT